MIPVKLLNKISKVREQVSIKKDSEANVGKYSYAYAKLEDITDQLNPILNELKLWYHWTVVDDKLTVTVYDVETGEFVSSAISLDDDHQKFQEIGKQLTYFSRYLLLLIFGIVAETDDDGNSSKYASTKSSSGNPKRRSRPQVEEDEDDEDEDDEEEEELPRRSRRTTRRRR